MTTREPTEDAVSAFVIFGNLPSFPSNDLEKLNSSSNALLAPAVQLYPINGRVHAILV